MRKVVSAPTSTIHRRKREEFAWGEIKNTIFAVLPEAVGVATAHGQFEASVRDLWYALRPVFEQACMKPMDAGGVDRWGYFSQNLLPEYRRTVDPLPLIYTKETGNIREPHSGEVSRVGGGEPYAPPLYRYDKILWIEKEEWWRPLRASGLPERYDLAVMTSTGYATEAMRELLADACNGREYQIFALHDADPAGYNMLRTLREDTARMRDHSVEVFDLGLNYDEAVKPVAEGRLGKLPETFTPKDDKRIAQRIVPTLTPGELEAFTEKPYKRVELNALMPSEREAYIERKLIAAGVRGKLIPPDGPLREYARQSLAQELRDTLHQQILDLVGADELLSALTTELAPGVLDGFDLRSTITRAFERNASQGWDEATDDAVSHRLPTDTDDLARDLVANALRDWLPE
jgi:hypothetical protein